MKTIIKIVALAGIALLFTGCTQPSFNPNVKSIVFVDGKTFRVPNGSKYSPKIYKKSDIEGKIAIHRKNGLDCRVDSLLWLENSISKELDNIMKKTADKKQGYSLIASAARVGKAGCAHPISDREYDFYRGQEAQQATANAAARRDNGQAIRNATQAWADAHKPAQTVNVNVQHEGTVRHNVNANVNVNRTNYNTFR